MNELLSLAMEAHGGLERWKRAQTLTVDLRLTGGLYGLKGQPQGFGPVTMKLDLARPHVSSSPYPSPSKRSFFTPERAWVEDASGAVEDERPDPRKSLEAIPREQPWSATDSMIFTSYAMWNYLTTPLLLTMPGVQTREIEQHQEDSQTWRVLLVDFPDDIPTHSRQQRFYFDSKGLLQRLDYDAVGPASHYCFDHREFDGLVFPTMRRVVRRSADGVGLVTGPTAVLIQISGIKVE